MSPAISCSKRGGAQVGSISGPWPLGKIEVSNSSVATSVLGKRRTLVVLEMLRHAGFKIVEPDK